MIKNLVCLVKAEDDEEDNEKKEEEKEEKKEKKKEEKKPRNKNEKWEINGKTVLEVIIPKDKHHKH